MIDALLIDDTEKARVALAADLKDYCPTIRVIGEADGVESGVEAIRRLKPQVIFLDIQMGDGTGFDLLEKVSPQNFEVIFTTAYNQYAIKAFKFSAVDYLLKPIDPDELVAAVEKLGENAPAEPQPHPEYELLLENIRKIQQTGVKKIALNTQDKVHIVGIDEIVRCESHSNYTLFYLQPNQQILVTKTLKEFEGLLGDYNFLRVHHSHLINLAFLKEFVKIDGGYAIMSNGQQVPVSSRKKDNLLKKLAEL
jgi:two-component system LytT family response regulator